MCERFDVSDQVSAAIASAVLNNFGVIDDSALENVIDQSKLSRSVQNAGKNSREDEECKFEIVNAIYVDGRKDVTLTTIETSDSKFHPEGEIEKHYETVGEPGELHLTHFSVEDGKEITVGKAIYKEVKNTDLQKSLLIVGSDGTAIMTGKHHGSIATLKHCHMSPAHRQITF